MIEGAAIYGLLAEFDTGDELLRAIRRVREAGYRQVDAYSPYPIEELADALEFRRTGVSPIFLIGGLVGGLTGYFLQYFVAVDAYPINIGGRPFNSWPMFVPVTFEMTVLFSALFGLIGMLALNGLPQPYHPVFNVPTFERVNRDGFFLCIQARDPLFDPSSTRQLLEQLTSRGVFDVPD